MNRFAYIGRNDHGKGLAILTSAFRNLAGFPLELHVFSESIDVESPNVIWHGWVDREQIWSADFNYVCLPMTAPETYCFALHEAVKHGKGLIVNGENESLISQISSGAHIYHGHDALRDVLIHFAVNKTLDVQEIILNRKRSIWTKI